MTMLWVFIGIYCSIFGILTWKRPVIAAGFLLATIPVYQIRFTALDVPFTILEIGMCVFTALIFFRERKQLFSLFVTPPLIPAMLISSFLIIGTVSLFWTPELTAGLGIWKAYILEPVAFAVAVYLSLKKTVDIMWLVHAVWILVIWISVIALIQFITGFGIPESWNMWPDRRSVSVFPYPNAVGLLLAPIITTALAWLIHGKQWVSLWQLPLQQQHRTKNLAIGAVFFGTLALFAARADGAVVATTGTAAFLLLFTRFRIITITLCSIGFVMLLIIPQTRDILLFKDVSGDVRIALWKGTVNLIQNQPLQGAGIGAFPEVYDTYRLPSHVELLQYPHNIVLDFWVEFGILGPLWLIVFFICTFKCLLSKRHQSHHATLLMAAPFVAIIIYGLVDSPYFKNDLSVLFWLWVALSYFILMQSSKPPKIFDQLK